MRALVYLAILAAVVTGLVALTHHPALAPAPQETNRDRWTRLCRVEAPRDVAGCVDRYALRFVFEQSNAAHERRLRDASR